MNGRRELNRPPLVVAQSLLWGLVAPKLRFNVEFKHALNKAAQIVAENLAECFIHLGRFCLASQRITELRLDHAER